MMTEELFREELLLEMRIDLEIREVLKKHKETAWKVMEYDLLPALDLHKYLSSVSNCRDVGKEQASKEWLMMMHNRTNLGNSERFAEKELRWILWEYGGKAWEVMQKRVKDFNDHRWYLGQWLRKDVERAGAIDDWIKKYTWYHSKELLKIEYDYKEGKYDVIERQMYDFVKQHRDEIEDVAQNRSRIECSKQELRKREMQGKDVRIKRKQPLSLIDATHLLLLDKKSVSPATEIAMQIEEAAKEAYITHNPSRNHAMIKWAKEHAAGWRDHYTSVLEFILRTQEEKFVRTLQEPASAPYARAG